MMNPHPEAEQAAVTPEFLARSQYNLDEIRQTEAFFGDTWYSIGGETEARRILGLLSPPWPRRVLDIGSGLGGASHLMARQFKAEVDGVEICPDMVQIARQRVPADLAGRVRIDCADILAHDPQRSYELAFSNNAFLHIHDKGALLQRLHGLLEPGGQLLFSDFCIGVDGPEMRDYISTYRYDILGVARWKEILTGAGFQPVVCEDATARHREYCAAALTHPNISDEWTGILNRRIARIDSGQHRWGVFLCCRN